MSFEHDVVCMVVKRVRRPGKNEIDLLKFTVNVSILKFKSISEIGSHKKDFVRGIVHHCFEKHFLL